VYSLSKQRLNPPGADLNSQRLARRVKAMDGLHKSHSSMKDEKLILIQEKEHTVKGETPSRAPAQKNSKR